MALAGGAISFIGAQQTAKAMDKAGDSAKELADAEALNIENETRESVFRQQENNQSKLAALRAEMRAGGGSLQGSAGDVVGGVGGRLELEILDAVRGGSIQSMARRQAGAMEQWNAKSQATGVRRQAVGNLFSSFGSAIGGMSGGSPKLTSLY